MVSTTTVITSDKYKKIIVISLYAPLRTKKSQGLMDHLTLNLQFLLLKYPKAGIVIAGDRNNVSVERFLALDHSLKLIVTKLTINGKVYKEGEELIMKG